MTLTPRTLARALADPHYASACLASLAPEARARFARLLSAEFLASPARSTALGPSIRSTRAGRAVQKSSLRAAS